MNQKKSGNEGKKPLRWCAIGDSFTYLNDHPEETGYRVTEGISAEPAERRELFP